MDAIHIKLYQQAIQHKHNWIYTQINIPKGRKVTYGSFVVDIKEHKEEQERKRFSVGGYQIEYPGDNSTRTAGLTTSQILINSIISNLGNELHLG
jgi:hypothetical protein